MQDIFAFLIKILPRRSGTEVTRRSLTTGGTEEHRVERGLFFPVISVDHALDPVPQVGDVKINQQADPYPAQPQVRQELCLMHGMDRLDALHFDDNQTLDNEIYAVSQFDSFSVENHWQTDLAGDCESSFSKFMSKTSLVGALQQPRTEYSVNVHGGRHDRSRNLINANRLERWRRSNHSN